MIKISQNKLRIAAFGFRSLPSSPGSAGADKFAEELLPRIANRGHDVIAYNRKYKGISVSDKDNYEKVRIKTFTTVNYKGIDTLVHSFKCTLHIIFKNSADIVHIQNGGNSIFAFFLRLAGKKVFISQDGVDWKRGKWPWYGKIFLRISTHLSARIPNTIIFDNIVTKRYFENRFKKRFEFIPFGSEVSEVEDNDKILRKYDLEKGQYYLFVGRFIEDKGLHYLIPAFKSSNSKRKLVLVGGSPNPSSFERRIKMMANENVVFPGYVYGDEVTQLMKNCYCYIQPSDVEGLSPVILTVMGLGVPLIVSDIEENIYAVDNTALKFKQSDIDSLTEKIVEAEANKKLIMDLAIKAKLRAQKEFNWETVTDMHIDIFNKY